MLTRPPFSLPEAAASTYCLHGFRHIYTTAMRQLDMPHDTIDDAGHWRRGSEMIRTYDSADCVHELKSKEKVRVAVEMGWRGVSAACLPMPAPIGPVPSTEGASSSSSSLPTCSSSSQAPVCTSASPISPTYVMEVATDTLHIWQGCTRSGSASAYTRCRKHRCGTPSLQTSSFMWAAFQPSHHERCMACFKAK